RDDAGRIVADIDRDYTTVRSLLNSILSEGSGVAVSKATAATIQAVTTATIGMFDYEGASAQDIARVMKLDKSSAWRRLSAARQDGFVVNLEQRKGQPGKYRATPHKVEPKDVLPDAATLAELFNASHPVSPPKPVQPCNPGEINEVSLGDN